MREIIKLTTAGLLTLILSCGNVSGQEQSSVPVKGKGNGMSNVLSAKQKEMVKQRTEKMQIFRKDFRASISQKQKDIIGNPRIMPVERKKEFRASLTDQQVVMIKSHKEDIKKMREEFRKTLTPEQKAAFKKMITARKARLGPRFKNSMEG
jgi:hypothetical protein